MAKKETLLIVEDDEGIQSQLKWSFDDYEAVIAGDREQALVLLRRHGPKVVTLDMGLPPDPGGTSEGLATLQEILALSPSTKVIVVTGNDDREAAVKAIGLGAYDFYLKPIDADILGLIVNRAFRVRELEDENLRLSKPENDSPLSGLIANSPQMLKICRTIEKVAPADVTTLLLGESGTGKEVLAKAIHRLSSRIKAPFVAINCAAIPENLLESELFGYEKGAFTGASKQTLGKIEIANGGTLFLDEIGDLPMSLQAKLLRFLQERVIERVGGRKEIPVDVRVVCATHQGLPEMIKDGSFREDLYYRLSEITIQIPAVREREGDAVLLARVFVDKFAKEQNKKKPTLSKDALLAIENYAWPGNVRELENKVKRATIMLDGSQITAEDLELDEVETDEQPFNLREVREAAERKAVTRALNHVGGNIAQAAEALGVSRPTLYDLIKKLNIEV
ncbi:MAG TPA: PEP-CTERM-box response regulator transcription factor [Gammaproteobacteria bacterium]|nr:PEP-CTERM-box response regulator transcription factor [Gammaproteobacteria bacterium]